VRGKENTVAILESFLNITVARTGPRRQWTSQGIAYRKVGTIGYFVKPIKVDLRRDFSSPTLSNGRTVGGPLLVVSGRRWSFGRSPEAYPL